MTRRWSLALVFAAVVTICLHPPSRAQTVTLGSGYVQITNFAGYRYPGVTEPEDAQPGWCPIWVPDFANNDSFYVDSNTTSISASLTTNSTTNQKTLRFLTGGPVTVGSSYTELWQTDPTVNGHYFTAARFDWRTSLPTNYDSSKYVRLELRAGWADDEPLINWSAQPGPGIHSGHVDVVFPEHVWDMSLRVAVVPVPEPSGLVCLLLGAVSSVGLARRRRS